MDQIGEPTQSQDFFGFNFLLGITQSVGVLLIILVSIWTGHFLGGFAWTSNPGLEFNWHPLLMIIGLVFLYGNGMLMYRMQRNVRKRRLKLLHAGVLIFAMLFAIIGLIAVFDSHNLKDPPIPNMYSLHSWVGLTSVILFSCQWVSGCVSFLFPGIQSHLRAAYMPVHVYFGTAGFVGAIASCLLGLNEKAFFALPDTYSQLPGHAVLINMIGMTLLIFGGLALYLVSQDRYKRLARPEDNVLLTNRNE